MLRVCLFIFLFLSSIAVGAQSKKNKPTESYKSTIQKAQELTLAQNRQKMTQLLVDALEKEPRESKAFKELKRTLLSLSEMFYTEKAQRVFESGRSLAETDIASAIEKFSEALSLEPGNIKVVKEMTRGFLTKGECKKALEQTKEALLLNPFNTEIFLLRLQSKACLGSIEDFEAELANPFVEKENIGLYLDIVEAQYHMSNEKYQSAMEALERAKQKDAKFPEIYYWLSLVKQKLKVKPNLEVEKYVSLCKDAPAKVRSIYTYEPRTCRELKNMERQMDALQAESI